MFYKFVVQFLDFDRVGDTTVKNFKKFGIFLPEHLLICFPKNYKDTTRLINISELGVNDKRLIEGRVSHVKFNNYGKKYLKFVITDESGSCGITMFKFYPNQVKMVHDAQYIRCYGLVDFTSGSPQMIHPEWAIINNGNCSLEKSISAIYGFTKISNKLISKIIKKMFEINYIKNILPASVVKLNQIMPFNEAVKIVHVVDTITVDEQKIANAKYAIKFEEMLGYKVAENKVQKDFSQTVSPELKSSKLELDKFLDKLPYELTNAQLRAVDEISKEMSSKNTMIRLLQGDVGSGKTIVATHALFTTAKSGYQSAIMAPTEILAEQHFAFLQDYLGDLGIEVVPLLGKLAAKQVRENLKMIATSDNCVVVGTHAIFQDRVIYKNLGLVVVDEQHRFGVEQRLSLVKKAKNGDNIAPHQLIISATPIPRTLAMTLYGNLKLSILDELPPGRKKIVTTVLSQNKKQQLIKSIKSSVTRGEQIYWVCPLVEESEELDTLQDVKSLHKELLLELGERVGLVYGSLNSKDKIQVMNDFKAKKYDVLVATTVIEVGVDIPNATIMIIDNAERLGISQLHQLRGRVGRGHKQSFCVLMYGDKISEAGRKRLSLMRESQDGFYLAEQDLQMRGAGGILGKEQSGVSVFRTFDINEYYQNYEKISQSADIMEREYSEQVDALIDRWFDRRITYVGV